MELIRIHLDTLKRKTVQALLNPNIFHAAIEASVQGERMRVLWRIDQLAGQSYLLMLTSASINTQFLIDQFGYPNETAQIADYSKLLEKVEDGTQWVFRLTANPVHREKTETNEVRGKILPHVSMEHQLNWLYLHAERNGFVVDKEKTKVVNSRWVKFRKKDSKTTVKLKEVTFEGVLTVTDAELFKKVLTDGFGRAKAYGMGLLTVIPYKS